MSSINLYLDKYRRMTTPMKAGLWFSICGFLQKGISFITMPIFTRILTDPEYGLVTVYNSWINIFSIFITLNVFYGVFNTAMIEFEKERDEYASSLVGFILSTTILFSALYVVLHQCIDYLTGMTPFLTICLFAQIFFQGCMSIWLSRKKFSYDYIPVFILTIILFILSPVVSIMLIKQTSTMHAEARVFGNLIAYVVVGIYAIVDLIRRGKTVYSSKYWKYVLVFGAPLIVHYLASTILGQSDRIMIDKSVGVSEAGFYAAAYSISSILTIVTTSINQAIVPWLYRCLKGNNLRVTTSAFSVIFIATTGGLFFISLFGPELLRLLATDNFQVAKWVIPPVTASLFFTFIYQVFANVEFYYKENKYIVLSSVAAALLNIFLNIIFINMFGFIAAGYTTLASYFAFGLFHYYCAKGVSKAHGIEWPYSDAFIIIISICNIVLPFIVVFLYINTIVRYVIVIIIAILIVVFRNRIKDLVSKIRSKRTINGVNDSE